MNLACFGCYVSIRLSRIKRYSTKIMSTASIRNPQDSGKSTWRGLDRKEWTIWHWFFEILSIHPVDLDKPVPVFAKTDKIPYASDWILHRWVLAYACVPLILHQIYASYTGHNLSYVSAYVLYAAWLNFTAIREIQVVRDAGHVYGYFDGDKHERDGVPDVRVREVVVSLVLTSLLRPLMAVMVSYRESELPKDISIPWLILELGMYPIMVDFWFYIYHRLMHDVPWLWQYHRTHHLTKHPNTLLSLYADGWQEAFDIFVIPMLAWASVRLMGMPMGFYETWICYEYTIFVELLGHSGLRVVGSPATPFSPLLRLWDLELVLEDHDLHHRTGWKKSHNYGKQTRLWDTVFGTKADRIESCKGNIEYGKGVNLPIMGRAALPS